MPPPQLIAGIGEMRSLNEMMTINVSSTTMPDEVVGGFALGRDTPTADPFQEDEEQSTAVERRDRQHVGDRQASAEQARQEEQRVPEAGVGDVDTVSAVACAMPGSPIGRASLGAMVPSSSNLGTLKVTPMARTVCMMPCSTAAAVRWNIPRSEHDADRALALAVDWSVA